jgi:hypothetical protein
MLLGRARGLASAEEASEPLERWVVVVVVVAAASVQPESRPARRPARPREAILKRLRLVREAGRKDMSRAPGNAW